MRRTPRRVTLLAGVLLAGLLSAGCVATIEPEAGAGEAAVTTAATAAPGTGSTNGSGSSSGTGSDTADGSETADGSQTMVRPMPLVGGGQIDLGAYLDRPLLLWFWAPF